MRFRAEHFDAKYEYKSKHEHRKLDEWVKRRSGKSSDADADAVAVTVEG